MQNLIGKECGCIFDLPPNDWPTDGYPAWVIVRSVDMPMVEMESKFHGPPYWINASKITKIWEVGARR